MMTFAGTHAAPRDRRRGQRHEQLGPRLRRLRCRDCRFVGLRSRQRRIGDRNRGVAVREYDCDAGMFCFCVEDAGPQLDDPRLVLLDGAARNLFGSGARRTSLSACSSKPTMTFSASVFSVFSFATSAAASASVGVVEEQRAFDVALRIRGRLARVFLGGAVELAQCCRTAAFPPRAPGSPEPRNCRRTRSTCLSWPWLTIRSEAGRGSSRSASPSGMQNGRRHRATVRRWSEARRRFGRFRTFWSPSRRSLSAARRTPSGRLRASRERGAPRPSRRVRRLLRAGRACRCRPGTSPPADRSCSCRCRTEWRPYRHLS